MDLPGPNFQSGIGVQAAVRHRYGELVNFFPISGLEEFYLLILVGRCKFRLCEQSIGLIPQATLDGGAADFRPQQISAKIFVLWLLRRRSFMFTILVPLLVTSIKSYSISGEMGVSIGSMNLES
jgi:hypothetical protein